MKVTKTLLLTLSAIGILGGSAVAGDVWSKAPVIDEKNPPLEPCFVAGEIQFDIISIYVDPVGGGDYGDYYGDESLDDSAGGGLGLGYYFTEYVGVRAEAYWFDGGSAIHSITGSLVVRYPFQDSCVAPYVYGGGGGHFDSVNQGSGHLGAGIEMRFNPSFGLFADYRYTWTEETEDWRMYTLGLRWVF